MIIHLALKFCFYLSGIMAGFRYYILYFILYSIGQSYKVGLLLNSDEQDESNAIKSLAQYTISKLNKSNTKLQLVERYHDSTYLNVMNNVCELIDENVVAIISGSDSTLTAIQVNMANQFHVPLVAAVAMVCVASFAQAQSSTTLKDLLEKVKQEGTAHLLMVLPWQTYQQSKGVL